MGWDKNTQSTYEVLFDPTSKVNSTEDENGFLKLFRSRYEKSLKILAMRPDSKRIKKIEKIKQEYNKKRSVNTSNRRNDEESIIIIQAMLKQYYLQDYLCHEDSKKIW